MAPRADNVTMFGLGLLSRIARFYPQEEETIPANRELSERMSPQSFLWRHITPCLFFAGSLKHHREKMWTGQVSQRN